MTDIIGQVNSHYRVLGKLGEGGMGVVYRAVDTRLDRQIALKLLPIEAVGDPERKWRFIREAKSASALNHPNIVTIYDIDRAPLGEGEAVDFIAMECVEGTTLDHILAKRRLTIEEALDFGTQIAGAPAAAHTAGIVHRDVKPAPPRRTSATSPSKEGHASLRVQVLIKDILDWLDRYLRPVRTAG